MKAKFVVCLVLLIALLAFAVGSSSSRDRQVVSPVISLPTPLPTASPVPTRAEKRRAVVSYYCEGFERRTTASGDVFSCDALTFAHRSLPFGTRVRFFYGGNSVVAVCNDRGPFVPGREFDLSKAAFARLAPTSKGVLSVRWEIVK